MTRDRSCRWRVLATAGALMFAATQATRPAFAEPRSIRALFTQHDAVRAFDFTTGKGYQTGTAAGWISGTTFVDFQFAPVGPPVGDALPITFTNKVIVTDVDGDQVFFDNNGTGTFHLGIPSFDFKGSGGPLIGTYVVTGGTGKFAHWRIGTTFRSRAVVTNPPSPAGALGNVVVEVSYHVHGRY